MALTLTLLVSLVLPLAALPDEDHSSPAVRFVDLTGDGLLDVLQLGDDGLSVSLNRSGGLFDPIAQELPAVVLADALVSDLDGDGLMDLYLVSPRENVALLGDGAGRFSDATEHLGLADSGRGVSAERVDMDLSGSDELLLHNTTGDVVFWATGNGYRRDALTPEDEPSDAVADTAALQHLVTTASDLLALHPGDLVVFGLDTAGQPHILRPRRDDGPSSSDDEQSLTMGPPPSVGPQLGDLVARTGFANAGSAPTPSVFLTPEQAEILSHLSIVYLDDGSGSLVNKTIQMSGVNFRLVNGSGSTTGAVDGRGNLIVGYNELSGSGDVRTGSHNLIVGREHDYSSFGGLAVGRANTISGAHASVSGGLNNTASGAYASVAGGRFNEASDFFASVGGGYGNSASAQSASVSGGSGNRASGLNASVSGGSSNLATGARATVSGGSNNTASGLDASVGGGGNNVAGGDLAWISGGRFNLANQDSSSVSGGMYGTASGAYSSVSGGFYNTAGGVWSSVSGGQYNTAGGNQSSVSGGNSRSALSDNDWVAGALFQDN